MMAMAICSLASGVSAKISINPPPEVESSLIARQLEILRNARGPLLAQYNATLAKIDGQEANCRSVEVGSAKASECVAEATEVKTAAKKYRAALEEFKKNLANARRGYEILIGMNALAKRLGWGEREQERLDLALRTLGGDGYDNISREKIIQTWDDILARDKDGELAKESAQGRGPGLPGAGEQTLYQDCTIFALANAAGIPYGVVAARATKLIGEGEWRSGEERADPQKVIETKGLIGEEVTMLAESLGQAEVVKSEDFAKVLDSGRPIMIDVEHQKGGGHEVVLTKTFQHGDETWYEMMDSNQGPVRRLYLSHRELNVILLENGVAFRPEEGTVPMLLR